MTPDQLAAAVLDAARAALTDLGLDPRLLPATAAVERPKSPEHGDYASAIAMQLARPAGVAPRQLAQAVSQRLRGTPGVAGVDVAGPGFLNVRLDTTAIAQTARTVVSQGASYGTSTALAGGRINLEYVSANPTGPIHIGGVRWAAVGDALARLLRATGADVTTEYYFNDAGAQIDRFAKSLLATAKREPVAEDGYAGDYIGEIAAAVVGERPDVLQLPRDQAQEVFRVEGVRLMFADVKETLTEFGVSFDVYFNERTLHTHGDLDAALARLAEAGHVYEAEGATWVRTTTFGDDKDRVIVKSNGQWGYFAGDCAYYLDKRRRGFDRVVMILGADHHGYVGRLRAMAACFGDDPDTNIEVLIGQLVNLTRNDTRVRLSKRAGALVTLREIIDLLGVDAARYALARYSIDSPIDLDPDLWTRRSADNPIFYVQYAHARIASLLRNAEAMAVTRGDDYDASLLTDPRERDLLRCLGQYPEIVKLAAELREPHRVARYLEELASTYHKFYDACRILPREGEAADDLTRARLWLAEAARIVFVNGLGLLGVSAPERM
ncbi:arginine--tRNA ligase [Dactylosporangium sp. NPDC051485]|uniref:arginine--tRNA ligase n=1 Tax=Dactylosporangium sp. NPDC051485 TaxID=3154846 RepID=UPI003433FE46